MVCACAGNAGIVFPRCRIQWKLLASDPGMHHGTCVTHVPWCMSGSLTCGDGENVPSIPGACAPAILRIWQETHGKGQGQLPCLNMNIYGINFRASSVPMPSKYNTWKTRVLKHIWWVKFRFQDRDFNWYQMPAAYCWSSGTRPIVKPGIYLHLVNSWSPSGVYLHLKIVSILVSTMAWCLISIKPSSKPMLTGKELLK